MRERSLAASLILTGLPRGVPDADFERFLAETPPAGLLLFRRDYADLDGLRALVRRLRALAPRPLLVSVDEEGGFVSQLTPHLPVPPSARVLGRAAGAAEVEALGAYTGAALRALGVDIDFAPVLDVDAESTNPVIGPRAFSREPAAVAELGLAAAHGLARGGVLACAKHFPGHGDTRQDSHLLLPRCEADRVLLESRDLAPFRAAVAAGLPLVMVSHVHYPALAEDERPATLSPRVVTGLLRGEMGYAGAVVTDALEMRAVAERYSAPVAARLALEAGCDLLLYGAFTAEVREVIETLARELAAGDGRLARRAEEASAAVERLRALVALGAPSAPTRVPEGPPLDLTALCRRSLRWLGDPPRPAAGGRWLVVEPRWAWGPAVASLLAEAGWNVAARETWGEWPPPGPGSPAPAPAVATAPPPGAADADHALYALARRVPLTPEERAAIARSARERPTFLVALSQDAFLRDFPEAAGRLSACDPGEPMRRAVAAHLAETLRGPRA